MSRWIAALLVVVAAFALTAAQDDGEKPLRFPFGGSKSQLPFDVIEVDGKPAWRVVGRGSVRVEELIAGLASAVDLRITYDRNGANLAKNNVPFVGPDSGTTILNAELADYVSDLIAAADLTLVGHSTKRARVVSLSESAAYARAVSPQELASLPGTEWVSLTHSGLSQDVDARRLLDHFASAHVYVRSEDGVVIAVGRVEHIRNVQAILEKAGSGGSDGMTVVAYDLAGAVKVADAARVIAELFAASITTVDDLDGQGYRVRAEDRSDVNVSVVPGMNRLLVRASAADHKLVKASLDALK
jgi:hypothetical protein